MALRVNALMPRAAPPESLGMIIPGAELLFFPYELIGNAEPPASSTLHERGLGASQRVGKVLRKVFNVKHAAVVNAFWERRIPADANEQLQVAQGSDECVLVLGWKGPVDPLEQPRERDGELLSAVADGDAERRRGERNQVCGDGRRRRGETVGNCQRAPIAAEDDNARPGQWFYDPIVARALRYSCRLRGGPALLASASASARAVSKLVKHAILASTAARRIL
jgi:hypothetical protein